MEELTRDFKGVWIPREIYLNIDLSWTEKILLVEINSLDSGDGCYASNEYLGKFLGISEKTVANLLSNLRDKGYIIDRSFDGRKRFISVNAAFPKTGTHTSRKRELTLPENGNILIKDNSKVYKTISNDIVIEQKPITLTVEFIRAIQKQDESYERFVEVLKTKYPEHILREELSRFASYWTEPNHSGTKQRWQLQKTFDVSRRFNTWMQNCNKFSNFNKKGVVSI